MEASGTPTSPSTSSPVSPSPATPPSDKAGGGLRALAVLGALVLAFITAVAIIVVFDIADTSTCDDVRAGTGTFNSDGECYANSNTIKTVALILAGIGSVFSVGSVLAALAFAIRGRGGRLLVQLIVAAAVFLGLSLIIG